MHVAQGVDQLFAQHGQAVAASRRHLAYTTYRGGLMPNQGSAEDPVELAKFPLDGEQEIQDHMESVELEGEVRVPCDTFREWLSSGSAAPPRYPCATAVLRYACDQPGTELRGADMHDSAWELWCRTLSHPADASSVGSREV